MEILPEGLLLEAETYNALISTLRRDCRVLESFRIMDYSLLIGIHNLDMAAKEEMVRNCKSAAYRNFVFSSPWFPDEILLLIKQQPCLIVI